MVDKQLLQLVLQQVSVLNIKVVLKHNKAVSILMAKALLSNSTCILPKERFLVMVFVITESFPLQFMMNEYQLHSFHHFFV